MLMVLMTCTTTHGGNTFVRIPAPSSDPESIHIVQISHLSHFPSDSTSDRFHCMVIVSQVAAAIEEVYPQLRTAFLSSAGVQALHKTTPAQADAQLSKSASTPRAVLVWLNTHNSLAPISPPPPSLIATPSAAAPPTTDLIPPSKTRPESGFGESGPVAGDAENDGPVKGGAAGPGEERGGGGFDSARSTVSTRPMVVGVLQAAALLCHNYLACNTHDATVPR